jgi:hypothetical protein
MINSANDSGCDYDRPPDRDWWVASYKEQPHTRPPSRSSRAIVSKKEAHQVVRPLVRLARVLDRKMHGAGSFPDARHFGVATLWEEEPRRTDKVADATKRLPPPSAGPHPSPCRPLPNNPIALRLRSFLARLPPYK